MALKWDTQSLVVGVGVGVSTQISFMHIRPLLEGLDPLRIRGGLESGSTHSPSGRCSVGVSTQISLCI